MSKVLATLKDFDQKFAVTTLVAVNDHPVIDQFFGIIYGSEGKYVDLGTVYANEETKELSCDPAPEIRQWVENIIGQSLDSYSTQSPEDIANAATELLGLEQLRADQAAGEKVSPDDVHTALLGNQYISTPEITVERQSWEKNDTG